MDNFSTSHYISFIYLFHLILNLQHEIVAAGNARVWKYHEETPLNEVTIPRVAAAMQAAPKESIDKLYKKLSKIVSVANLASGKDWLEEVLL